MVKKENEFQSNLIKEIKIRLPGCVVAKIETYKQGFPDLLILFKSKWAMLECKREEDAARQPNQPYYVDLLNKMSFASFIYPENKEEVLSALEQSFKSVRKTRGTQAESVLLD